MIQYPSYGDIGNVGRRSSIAKVKDQEPTLSIVVPAFNEAARIGNSLKKIDDFMQNSSLSYEVIVVDDGSTDDTPGVVRRSKLKGLRFIQNPRNQGKGFTVRNGVLAAAEITSFSPMRSLGAYRGTAETPQHRRDRKCRCCDRFPGRRPHVHRKTSVRSRNWAVLRSI